MDVLLLVLQVLFISPVLLRLAKPRDAGPEGRTSTLVEMRAGFRRPPMLLHGMSVILLWVALAIASRSGAVSRAVTVHGTLGAACLLAGTAMFTWSFGALRSWRLLPELDAGHQLCTTGPYAIVRHPMYMALDLLAVGSAIWVPTPFVIIAAMLVMVGGDLRARAEERALLFRFGDHYRQYMNRVRRAIPGVY